MDRHLNLIKTDYKDIEKRIFPRFPFSYLTFKGNEKSEAQVFEVKDISFLGMQLNLKNGGHSYITGHEIEGTVHWKGAVLKTIGVVKWVRGTRIGVSFNETIDFEDKVKKFLSVKNIIAGMRPVHSSGLDLEMPANLKYWLRADGPVELFIWQHADCELSKFQFILLDHFLEWEDGKGLRSGHIVSKEDNDTPLTFEDELMFQFDEMLNLNIVEMAQGVVREIPIDFLNQEVSDFLKTKIGL
ncbi:MAG: hypothetical protein HN576_04585 [Bacteriovoracaceae bacterium]|jgi:hypothetical protein|nr:hypothetical protein [Bacteriovoracaceae bacterium]